MNITGKRKHNPIRSSREYQAVIKTVKERAGGKDEITGKKCKRLQCHHIEPISKCPERSCDPSNMIMIDARLHVEVVHNGNFDVLNGMSNDHANAYRSLYLLAH